MNSDATPGLELPLTGWFSFGEWHSARATMELRGKTHADIQVHIVLQFADHPLQSSRTK